MSAANPEWQKVHDAPLSGKRKVFRAYCEELIARKEKGEVSVAEASYNICGTALTALEYDGKRDAVVSDIADIACDLELPPEHRSRPPEDWDKLVRLITKLR